MCRVLRSNRDGTDPRASTTSWTEENGGWELGGAGGSCHCSSRRGPEALVFIRTQPLLINGSTGRGQERNALTSHSSCPVPVIG